MSTGAEERTPIVELLAHRGYWRWASATMFLRLPPIMAPLALVLVSVEYTGSPRLGGILLLVSLIPGVLASPVMGRALDRLGVEKWSPRALLVGAVGRLALAAAFVWHAPSWVLIAIALIGTTISAGVSGAIRTLLNRVVPKRLIGPALSIDATLVELVVISAPFAVVLTALPGAAGALVAMGASTAIGALLLRTRAPGAAAADAQHEPAAEEPLQTLTALRKNPQFVYWLLVTLAFGHLLGTAETGALPAVLRHGGGSTDAAVLIGVLGAGSALAGVAYAWFSHRLRLGFTGRSAVLLVLMIASGLAIALVDTWVGLLIAFVAMGLWTAPLASVMSEAPGYVIPRERETEAFNILNAAQVIGFSFAGVLLATVSVPAMLLLGPATALVALLLTPVLMRGRRPPP